ncbi:hypothetical protein [Methanolobus halotolerans]|nr:hypothetical protein [Methanolobus halotolerans]
MAEYDQNQVKLIVHNAAKEIKPGFADNGIWYEGDSEHVGLISVSEHGPLTSEMQNIDYWDLDEMLITGEFPNQIVSSSIMFSAPAPGGYRVLVQIDGYNLPLSTIRPVSENIFTRLVEQSVASGDVSKGIADNGNMQTGEYSEEEFSEYQDPELIPDAKDDTADGEMGSTEHDDESDGVDDLLFTYQLLEVEGLVENEGEIDIDDISKQDIDDYQKVHMNYVLSENFIRTMQDHAKIVNIIRAESSEDIDKLGEMDLGEGQDAGSNKEKIEQVFGNDFSFEVESPVKVKGGADYDGKDRVAGKLGEIMDLEVINKTTKDTLGKVKTGHEAASFFSDSYPGSKISKTFERMDKINSVKEEVDKYVEAYKNYEKLSEMKGASGTSAKALYAVSRTGQEVAGKIPVVGEFIKKELEVAEKIVMVIPELDNAIKNSDARQGKITNGGIGTSTPNAFLSEYGKVTQTSSGPSYSMPYTDENGQEHEIRPDFWIKVTTNGETYYVPTDEWENPIGDVAIKDIGSSWKPWKWDNCQVVKRTDPKISYNNGEEYDL